MLVISSKSDPGRNNVLSDELIPLLQEGNESAFAILFHHFYPPLCFFAERLIKDSEESQDIVTNVFTAYWKRCADFPDHTKIKAFLYVSVRNACMNYVRNLNTRINAEKELLYLAKAEEDTIAEREQLRSSIWESVFAEIQALPDQLKTVFTLLYFDRLDTKAVSAKMNLPVQTVRNYKTRAIDILRKRIITNDVFLTVAVATTAIQLAGLLTLVLMYLLGWFFI